MVERRAGERATLAEAIVAIDLAVIQAADVRRGPSDPVDQEANASQQGRGERNLLDFGKVTASSEVRVESFVGDERTSEGSSNLNGLCADSSRNVSGTDDQVEGTVADGFEDDAHCVALSEVHVKACVVDVGHSDASGALRAGGAGVDVGP